MIRGLALALLGASLAVAQTPSGTLQVYFVDVEGGQATLL